jgi:hypothetical protein
MFVRLSFAWRFPIVAALVLVLPAAWCLSAPDELPDPVPMQRVLLSPERLAEEMERVKQGALVQLPRGEFEEQVHKAAKALAPKNGPRLIEARYRASLVENGGLAGTGQWKIIYPGTGPALLPLAPFNIALAKPRYENHEALVADFDGKGPALLVEDGGEQSVAVEWSARAEPRPEGLYFALEWPAAPVGLLELDLPADREPSGVGGAVVAGPYPSEAADHRLWKIAWGGRPGVNLWVRRSQPAATSGPALFVRQHTIQRLLPEGLNATYQLEIDVTRPGVRLLVCEIDADLRPTEIEVANLEKSELRAGTGGGPSQLFLTLREPPPVGQEALQIRCLAPLGALKPAATPREGRVVDWTSPGVRLAQVGFQADRVDPAARVVPRGETLEIRCHPDVRLEDWKAGGFRLTDAGPRTDPDQAVAIQMLTLQGGGVESEGTPAGKAPRRPSARLHAGGVDFRARQAAWWQIADDRMSLTLQITYDVNQGQLFQMPVHLPAGWDIERVELNPSDRVRNWNVRPDANGSTLFVDLSRPVTPADDFRRDKSVSPDGSAPRLRGPTLTVRLNSTRREGLTSHPWPFPDATPLGARLREGSLAVDVSDLVYDATLKATLEESEPGAEEGPWGSQAPDHYFSYRGKVLAGTLELRPRAPKLRAACTTDVYLAADRVETRLVVEAEAGSVDTVDVYLSAPEGEPARWRVESGNNPLRRVEHLYGDEVLWPAAVLGAQSLPAVTGNLAVQRRGEYWRLVFTRPLRGHSPLVLHASRALEVRDGRWEAPLPVVLNAGRMEGEVTLHLAGANRLPLEMVGLREAAPATPPTARAKSNTAWRIFRYTGAEGLLLRGPLPPRLGSAAATVERADLTTILGTDGGLEHHFSFRLANWPRATLPLPLPPGGRLLAARVDGHWLPRPALTEGESGNTVLELPVPAGADGSDAAHRFEVTYATAGSAWTFWTRADAPRPTLPAEPLAYRHTWRLPPGVSPLFTENYRRLPGPGESFEPAGARAWSSRVRPLLRTPLWPTASQDSAEALRQALADAVQAIRRRNAGRILSLAEVVEQTGAELAKGGRALVLDAEALHAAGLTPQTPVAVKALASAEDQTAPWDGLGLATAPAGSALLLTTDRQLELWREGAGTSATPAVITDVVVEAAAYGQDTSGRFRAVWAGPWSAPSVTAPVSPAEWTAWEALPGGGADTSIIIVHSETLSRAGLSLGVFLSLGLAAVLILVGYATRRWGRWRLAPLLAWLGLAGLGVLFLPAAVEYLAWAPLLAGGAVGFLWYAGTAVWRRAPATGTGRVAGPAVAAAVGLGLLLLTSGPAGRAAPPTPVTVFVVPGPEDAPQKQSVLVPPDLLEQLKTLARSSLAAGAVLVSAEYEGKIADEVADLDAAFAVQCLGDDKVTLPLLLDGVQLYGEVWLDGAPAQVSALVAPQTGFALKFAGKGRHKVELHFRVPVTGPSEDRTIQFTAPRLVQSRLRLKLPKDAAYVQTPVKYGAQRVTACDDGKLLEVDLGRVAAPVQVHWSQPARAQRPAKVQFREAYFWDLRADAATLYALLHYEITDGPVTSLVVQLPADLEVRSAEARRVASATGPNGAVRLRDYRVDPGAKPQAVELRFAAPVRGEVQVQLDLVPAAPLPATVTLPVPTPLGTPHAQGSYLAYRVQGLEATRTNYLRVSGVPFADFAPFWPAGSRPESVTDAYVFRREGGQGPVLTLRLRPQPPVRAVQEIAVRVGTQQARVHATLDLSAANKDLALVEWEIQSPQPFTVAAVTGPDVRGWTQTGNRVQVWLEHALKEARLEMSGWTSLVPDNQRLRLELPNLRVPAARSQQTTVRLTAATGLGFVQAQPRNLTAAADATPGDQELAYHTDRPDYGGTFLVHPAATGPEVRALTVVEVRGGRLGFMATLDYQTRGADLRTVAIRLSDWEGEDVRLDAPRVAQRRERRHASDDRTWVLSLQPGTGATFRPAWSLAAGPAARLAARPGGHYRCTLSGSMPLTDAAGEMRVPKVSVSGAGSAEYVLALAGKELTPETPAGLTPLPTKPPAIWKDELARLARDGGTAWKTTAPDWQMRVSPASGPSEPGPIVVFLTEQTAAVVDQARWLHEAVYTFRHEAGAELDVTLPEGARLVSAALDGTDLGHLTSESPRLALLLPNRAGVRRLHLRWVYDAGREYLAAPNLDRPHFDGARDGPILYTVLTPPGFSPEFATSLRPGPARAAALDLAEATAQLSVSAYLAGQRAPAVDDLADAQQRFVDACRRVQRIVDAVGDQGEPGKPSLVEQLQALQKTNRDQARQLGYDGVRVEAEHRTGAGPRDVPAEEGQPRYSTAAPDETAPRLLLQSVQDRRHARKSLAAVAWFLVLAVVGLLACFRGLVSVVKWFWPEQVTLLGAAAWLLTGPTLPAVLLVLLGVAARGVYLAGGVRRLVARSKAQAGTSSHLDSGKRSGT